LAVRGCSSPRAFAAPFWLGHDEKLVVGILLVGALLAAQNQEATALAEDLCGGIHIVLLDTARQIRLVAFTAEILPQHS
jgi:hypothetical protein